MLDPELLERITARRAELDEFEEQLTKQLAEMRAERDELAVAEHVHGSHPPRQLPLTVGVDHHAVMLGFARIRTGPQFGHGHLRSRSCTCPSRRPRQRFLTKRSSRAHTNQWPSHRGAQGCQSVEATPAA
ncbi:hypothetical protein ACFCX0_41600 [Streptomyces sp. NPDC056352]|uniref:hypothetical protein n=1 Tax=Streptomyces sp. NPDC056352 TaxID=3345791 RepID=UPI0035DD38E2